jgi:hypothetical protein
MEGAESDHAGYRRGPRSLRFEAAARIALNVNRIGREIQRAARQLTGLIRTAQRHREIAADTPAASVLLQRT